MKTIGEQIQEAAHHAWVAAGLAVGGLAGLFLPHPWVGVLIVWSTVALAAWATRFILLRRRESSSPKVEGT